MKKIISVLLILTMILPMFTTASAVPAIQITFDLNGGNSILIPTGKEDLYKEEKGLFIATIPYGTSISRIPSVFREEYSFLGWFDESNNQISQSTVFTKDTTLKARWEKISYNDNTVSIKLDPLDSTYISFKNSWNLFTDDSGAYIREGKYWVATLPSGSALPEIPVATKPKYIFNGWLDESGNIITQSTKFYKSTILTASFSAETPSNRKSYNINVQTNPNIQLLVHGSVYYSGDEIRVDVISSSGYNGDFYIITDDENSILLDTQKKYVSGNTWSFIMPATDITLVPIETKKEENVSNHNIKLTSNGRGSARLSTDSSPAGETVYITIAPESRARMQSISATTESNTYLHTKLESENYYSFNMPDENVKIVVNFINTDDTDTPPDLPHEGNIFKDIPQNEWFAESVEYVYNKGIMDGIGDNNFGPYINTTRGMLVTILHRMVNCPEVSYSLTFQDISTNAFYYKALQWATRNKIVTGYSEKEFGPNDILTREQLVTILYRFAISRGLSIPSLKYSEDFIKASDIHKVSEYAIEPMNWAITNRIIFGTTEDYITLSPLAYVNRSQTAIIFHRWMSFLGDNMLDNLKINEMKY